MNIKNPFVTQWKGQMKWRTRTHASRLSIDPLTHWSLRKLRRVASWILRSRSDRGNLFYVHWELSASRRRIMTKSCRNTLDWYFQGGIQDIWPQPRWDDHAEWVQEGDGHPRNNPQSGGGWRIYEGGWQGILWWPFQLVVWCLHLNSRMETEPWTLMSLWVCCFSMDKGKNWW